MKKAKKKVAKLKAEVESLRDQVKRSRKQLRNLDGAIANVARELKRK